MSHSYKSMINNRILETIDFKKFGTNPSLPTTFQEIWTGEEDFQDWDARLSPTIPVVLSESSEDVGVEITVAGLDEDGYLHNEKVILNGTTPVSLTSQFTNIFRAGVTNDVKELTGNVLIYNAEQTILKAHVPNSGNNQTLTLFWTVPKGFYMICKGFRFTLGQGKEVEIRQQVRLPGETWRTQDYLYMYENSIDFPCKIINRVEELTDIRFQAKGSVGGVPISGVSEFTFIEYSPNSSINPNK